jgi:hypothetical protein
MIGTMVRRIPHRSGVLHDSHADTGDTVSLPSFRQSWVASGDSGQHCSAVRGGGQGACNECGVLFNHLGQNRGYVVGSPPPTSQQLTAR